MRTPTIPLRTALALAPALFLPSPGTAIDVTWDGGGAPDDLFWQTPANWVSDSPPVAFDSLIFAGSTGLFNTNNLPADTTFTGITFSVGAGSFFLQGNTIQLSGNVTNLSNSQQNIALGLGLDFVRTFTLTSGGGNLSILGNISGAGGITLAGTGTLTLSGSNTQQGNVTFAANQTVNLNSTTALGTGQLVVAGNGTFNNTSGQTLSLANGITLSGGSPTFAGSNNLIFNGPITVLGANRTITVSAGALTLNGAVGDEGQGRALSKAGAGTLVLNGTGTHSGGAVLNGGLVRVGNDAAFGTGQINVAAIAAIEAIGSPRNLSNSIVINNTYLINGNVPLNLSGSITNNGGSRTVVSSNLGGTTLSGTLFLSESATTARNLTLSGVGDYTITGVIANNSVDSSVASSLTKNGPGTATFSGANTFTGAFTVNSGRAILDLTQNPSGVFQPNINFTLNAARLEFRGSPIAASAQSLGNPTLTTNSGVSSIILNGNGGPDLEVSLGSTWTRNSGTYLLIDLSSPNVSLKSTPNRVGFGPIQDMIVGSGNAATVAAFMVKLGAEYDFAARGEIEDTIRGLGATTPLPDSLGDFQTPYLLNSNLTLTSPVDASTLRVDVRSNDVTLDLDIFDLVLNNFTFLVYGDRNFTIDGSGFVGGPAFNRTAVFTHFGAGKVTINSAFSGGSFGIQLAGEGLYEINGPAVGTGTVIVLGATGRFSSAQSLSLDAQTGFPGTGNIILNGGGILELGFGDLTRNLGTGAGALQWLGEGGFAAFGAPRMVDFPNITTLVWNNANMPATGNALILGSPFSDNTLTFAENIELGAAVREVRVFDGTNANDIDGRLSGVLTGGSTGGLMKTGPGTLELSGDSTFSGQTDIQAGRLLVTGSLSGTREVVVRSGSTLGGDGSITTGGNGDVIFESGSFLAPGLSPGTLTISTGSGSLDLRGNAADAGAFKFELGAASDRILLLSGTLTIGSGLINFDSFEFTAGEGFGPGTYTLFDSDSVISGSLGANLDGMIGGLASTLSLGDSNRDIILTVIPEPSSAAFALAGSALLGLRRRRA